MTVLPVTVELMQPGNRQEVSRLLAYSFQDKFAAFTKVDLCGLAMFFERLMEICPEGPSVLRVVALQGEKVIGTLSLKLPGSSSGNVSRAVPSFRLSAWKNISRSGTIRTLLLLTALYALNHEPSPGEGYIADLAVHPEYRGQGVGQLLVQRAQQYLKDHPHLHYLGLHVSGRNRGAKQLYERLSFSTLRVERSLLSSLLFQEEKWEYMICRE